MAIHFFNKFAGVALVFSVFVQPALANQPIAHFGFMSGKVLLNSGHGFNAALATDNLRVGDRVLVGKDSLVTVVFDQANCSVSYSSATVISVPTNAPCKSGDTVADAGGLFVLPVNGGAVVGSVVGGLAPETVGLATSATIFLTAAGTTLTQAPPQPVSVP